MEKKALKVNLQLIIFQTVTLLIKIRVQQTPVITPTLGHFWALYLAVPYPRFLIGHRAVYTTKKESCHLRHVLNLSTKIIHRYLLEDFFLTQKIVHFIVEHLEAIYVLETVPLNKSQIQLWVDNPAQNCNIRKEIVKDVHILSSLGGRSLIR